MELNTPAQESAGGWMEVQPTSEKPAIPEESVSWNFMGSSSLSLVFLACNFVFCRQNLIW